MSLAASSPRSLSHRTLASKHLQSLSKIARIKPIHLRSYTVPSTGRAEIVQNTPLKPPTPPPTPPLAAAQDVPDVPDGVLEATSSGNMPFNLLGLFDKSLSDVDGSVNVLTHPTIHNPVMTTIIGIGVVFVGSIIYNKWYQRNVLNKIEKAFAGGYDPVLELEQARQRMVKQARANGVSQDPPVQEDVSRTATQLRKEQLKIGKIVHGEEPGRYFMLLGPKGGGKAETIVDAMVKCRAEGVSMCSAHPDLEVFRLRLGRALDFKYKEDAQTSLFKQREPRQSGPTPDIEQAMHKLEQVALRRAQKRGKPLVLVIDDVHLFRNNDEGRNMLLLLQQRAEAWATSGIVTMVFNSDDFWPYQLLSMTSRHMSIERVNDLDPQQSLIEAASIRQSAGLPSATDEEYEEAISLVGGRLSYISRISRAKDMVGDARQLLEVEKAWIQSRIGLIPEFDPDMIDEQKWSSCSWLLLCEFVKQQRQRQEERRKLGDAVEKNPPLPSIPYWKCRRIMTREDFMEKLDRLNIIAIDDELNVRPDSNLVLHSARQITEQSGFDQRLNGVRARINELDRSKDLEKGRYDLLPR